MPSGRIVEINYKSGKGLIQTDSGLPIPFSNRDLRPGMILRSFRVNSAVTFYTMPGPRGMRSLNVSVVPGTCTDTSTECDTSSSSSSRPGNDGNDNGNSPAPSTGTTTSSASRTSRSTCSSTDTNSNNNRNSNNNSNNN